MLKNTKLSFGLTNSISSIILVFYPLPYYDRIIAASSAAAKKPFVWNWGLDIFFAYFALTVSVGRMKCTRTKFIMISYLVIWFCLFPFRLNKNKTFQEIECKSFSIFTNSAFMKAILMFLFFHLQNSTWDLYISDLLCIDN